MYWHSTRWIYQTCACWYVRLIWRSVWVHLFSPYTGTRCTDRQVLYRYILVFNVIAGIISQGCSTGIPLLNTRVSSYSDLINNYIGGTSSTSMHQSVIVSFKYGWYDVNVINKIENNKNLKCE